MGKPRNHTTITRGTGCGSAATEKQLRVILDRTAIDKHIRRRKRQQQQQQQQRQKRPELRILLQRLPTIQHITAAPPTPVPVSPETFQTPSQPPSQRRRRRHALNTDTIRHKRHRFNSSQTSLSELEDNYSASEPTNRVSPAVQQQQSRRELIIRIPILNLANFLPSAPPNPPNTAASARAADIPPSPEPQNDHQQPPVAAPAHAAAAPLLQLGPAPDVPQPQQPPPPRPRRRS